jgi:hypothetical protein
LGSLQQPVSHGHYFTPFGKDTCEKCKCLAGKAVGCFFEKCPQLPGCGKYKSVEGTCCEFECLQGKTKSLNLTKLFALRIRTDSSAFTDYFINAHVTLPYGMQDQYC